MSRDQLEAAIDEVPDDPAAYLVYADWLQERLDPRAELIALHAAATPSDRMRALERALSPRAPSCAQQWFYGFVSSVQWILDSHRSELVQRAFDHPSWRHLTKLGLTVGGAAGQWLVDVIAERPRPCWRSLMLDCREDSLELDELWPVLPRITSLHVHARRISLGAVRSTWLQILVLDGAVTEIVLDAPNLHGLMLRDVHPAVYAGLVEVPIRSLLELEVPQPDAVTERRLREHYPFVTFTAPGG